MTTLRILTSVKKRPSRAPSSIKIYMSSKPKRYSLLMNSTKKDPKESLLEKKCIKNCFVTLWSYSKNTILKPISLKTSLSDNTPEQDSINSWPESSSVILPPIYVPKTTASTFSSLLLCHQCSRNKGPLQSKKPQTNKLTDFISLLMNRS